MIYASIILEKWPNKGLELFKYMQTVRLAVSRGYFGGWIQYDEQYRLRKAISPCSSWGVVDMELWMMCVSTPHSPPSGPSFSTQPSRITHSSVRGTNRFATPPLKGTCRAFNSGKCTFGKNCKFPHKCSKCNGNHPFINCRS